MHCNATLTPLFALCALTTGPPSEEVHEEATVEKPLHATIGASEIYLQPLEQAICTMREGERAIITIHPRVAYGSSGSEERKIPPDTFLEYEIILHRVFEVCYLAQGRIVKKSTILPLTTGQPDAESEVTLKWQGKLHPSGKLFKPTTTQTFKLNESGILPFWPKLLMGNKDNHMGGRGMGEGEVSEFVVPPDLAFGEKGYPKWGVPPNTAIALKVTLVSFATFDDISSAQDGSAIRRTEKRGFSEDKPQVGDECECAFRISNQRTGEVYHAKPMGSLITIGRIPERQREAIRAMCVGAHADRVLELLMTKMHDGEISSVRCTPQFIGGQPNDDTIVWVSLKHHVKLFKCNDTDGKVNVRVLRDPHDARGVSDEATCKVRYVVRARPKGLHSGPYDEVVEEEGGKIIEKGGVGKIHYLGCGETIAESELSRKDDGVPLYTFVHGQGHVLPCIDHAVRVMRPGGYGFVTSPAEYAYGAKEWKPSDAKGADLVTKYKDRDVEVEIELVKVSNFKQNYMMELDEKVDAQVKRKEQGNQAFKEKDYVTALKRYDDALEYAAMASEVCMRDIPYAEQHKQRKHIEDNRVATHVNMAVCYMRIAEMWREKESKGEEVPSEWYTAHSKNSQEENNVGGKVEGKTGSAIEHISKAVYQCCKALNTDKESMKAHYRRGQAFIMMGDLVKAKDDLTSAARKAPNSVEIRAALEEVRRLEEEEAEKAKALWKGGFIKEQMSFRAQQGAASVSEALGEKPIGGSKAAALAVKEEEEKREEGDLADLDDDDDDDARIVDVTDEVASAPPAAAQQQAAAAEEAEEDDDDSSDDDVVIEDVTGKRDAEEEAKAKGGVPKLKKGFLAEAEEKRRLKEAAKAKAVEEAKAKSVAEDEEEQEKLKAAEKEAALQKLREGAARMGGDAEEASANSLVDDTGESAAAEGSQASNRKVGQGTPLGAGFLDFLKDPKAVAEAKERASKSTVLNDAGGDGEGGGKEGGHGDGGVEEEEELMPWDPEPPRKPGGKKGKKKKVVKVKEEEEVKGEGEEGEGVAALARRIANGHRARTAVRRRRRRRRKRKRRRARRALRVPAACGSAFVSRSSSMRLRSLYYRLVAISSAMAAS